jgi:hypothetical protein
MIINELVEDPFFGTDVGPFYPGRADRCNSTGRPMTEGHWWALAGEILLDTFRWAGGIGGRKALLEVHMKTYEVCLTSFR